MPSKGTPKINKETFDGVIKLLGNGWTPATVAKTAHISVSSVGDIRAAKTWKEWQRRRAARNEIALAAKRAKVPKTEVAARAAEPAVAKKRPATPRKRVSRDDTLQASLDSIRREDLTLVQGQNREILSNQAKILKQLDGLGSDVADLKYDTARIRWNSLQPFWRRKK